MYRYETLLRESSGVKEKVGIQIVKILEQVLSFQAHISNSLQELETLALDQFKVVESQAQLSGFEILSKENSHLFSYETFEKSGSGLNGSQSILDLSRRMTNLGFSGKKVLLDSDL